MSLEPVKESQRPARRQVDAPVTGREEVHAAGTVNIWTGRVLKEYRKPKEGRKKEASQYRCLPKADSGWTRGSRSGAAYCCLYFARGICHHGADCNFLHRLPSEADEVRHRTDYSHDIFGRERGPQAKQGLKKGVGSYERECKTVYIHYGGAGTLPAEQLRQIIADNFAEWGPLENVHLVPSKTIAFVRYCWRSSAEFAKAAMHQQTLRGCDTQEILDVRWAEDDPNPRAVARVQHEREVALRDAYVRAVNDLPPEAKRARIQQLHLAATVRPGAASAAYPDTDSQYGGGGVAGYQHMYEGWDAFHYQQQQGATPSGTAVGTMRGGFEGFAAMAAAAVGSGGEAVDDVSRYLPPEELWGSSQQQHAQQQQQQAWAQPGHAWQQPGQAWQAPPQQPSADAAQQQSEQEQQQEGGADEEDAAQQALGLIGGYGSGSESDSEGSGKAADGEAA